VFLPARQVCYGHRIDIGSADTGGIKSLFVASTNSWRYRGKLRSALANLEVRKRIPEVWNTRARRLKSM